MKLLNISGKQSAPGSGSKDPQKKLKLAADEDGIDDDFDEEAEEKTPVKKYIIRYSSQICTEIKPEWKRLKTINAKIKGQEFFKYQEKNPQSLKGPRRH